MLSSSLNHYNALALLLVQTSKSNIFLSHIAHQGNHRGAHPVQTRQEEAWALYIANQMAIERLLTRDADGFTGGDEARSSSRRI
jgi:hypothetical protein